VDREHHANALCALSDIGERGKEICIKAETGPQWLMLYFREGRLTAWRNVCPHQGRALNWAPDEFLFSPEGQLVCSHHGASFDLQDGQCVAGPCKGDRLTAVDVELRNDWVYLSEGQ
jgi:nitrite reductase/ring-hydroxylating ferredoxin subunit